jgi:hypothetical protein
MNIFDLSSPPSLPSLCLSSPDCSGRESGEQRGTEAEQSVGGGRDTEMPRL